MILKEVYLYPDLVEYPDKIVHPFRDQSRSICNFLERQLKAFKFNADGFKRICIIGKSLPTAECFVNSSKVLVVEVQFDQKQYLELNEEGLNPYFAEILKAGFTKCKNQFTIPVEELMAGLDKFCADGYINEWCFKTKEFKPLGIKCSLNCKLTTKDFTLTFLVSKGSETIFEKNILKTEPDEIVFVPMFKDISLDGDKLVVLDKYGERVYSMLIEELNINNQEKKN